MSRGKLNILVSGGTGAGKTTTLNVLSSFIPEDERIVTIEDAAELQLHQDHVLRLEARPPNIEGRGEVKVRDLVRNSLRMRPDRIVVGEVRDAAALDMLQAMNTGHDGSICTVHANTPRDVLARVETMVLMAGVDLPVRAIREQVSSAIDLVVQQTRFKDGTRHITHVTEVVGMEGDVITLQDLFLFDHGAGFDDNGRSLGHPEVDGAAAEVPRQARGRRRPGRPLDLRLREVRGAMSVRRTLDRRRHSSAAPPRLARDRRSPTTTSTIGEVEVADGELSVRRDLGRCARRAQTIDTDNVSASLEGQAARTSTSSRPATTATSRRRRCS